MTKMKAFKTYGAAKKYAAGKPVIKVGKLYLVDPTLTAIDMTFLDIALIAPNGRIHGHVTMKHLERLGNANWAVAKDDVTTRRLVPLFPDAA